MYSTIGRSMRLALLGCCLALGLAPAADATVIAQNTSIGPLSDTLSNLTTGGPFTFISTSAVFSQFDSSLGTLNSATLSWTITGSENGSGNFAGTGIFNFDGQTQTVGFDTQSDPGPKNFNFSSSAAVSLAAVTGLGNFSAPFTATMSQSGFFPWAGTMSLDASQITLTYDYTPVVATSGVPEPATLAVFGLGLLGLGALRRRKTKAQG